MTQWCGSSKPRRRVKRLPNTEWALTHFLAQDAGSNGAPAQKHARALEQHVEAAAPNKFSDDDVLRRVATSAQGGGVLVQLPPKSFYGTAKDVFTTATRGLAAAWGVRRTTHAPVGTCRLLA